MSRSSRSRRTHAHSSMARAKIRRGDTLGSATGVVLIYPDGQECAAVRRAATQTSASRIQLHRGISTTTVTGVGMIHLPKCLQQHASEHFCWPDHSKRPNLPLLSNFYYTSLAAPSILYSKPTAISIVTPSGPAPSISPLSRSPAPFAPDHGLIFLRASTAAPPLLIQPDKANHCSVTISPHPSLAAA